MEDANAWRLCDGRANEIKDPVLMFWEIKVDGGTPTIQQTLYSFLFCHSL
jgi:hypothetical protein